MSNLAIRGDDHPEAASKHLEDATALHAAKRYDGAAYLSGYVAECSLKTLVIVANMGHMGLPAAAQRATDLKHNLTKISQEALHLASLPNSGTATYSPPARSRLWTWRPEMRYAAPAVAEPVASHWLAEARHLYNTTVAKMRLDGVIQ